MAKESKAGKLVSSLGDKISESGSTGRDGKGGAHKPGPSRSIDPRDLGRENDRDAMVIRVDQVIPDPDQPRKKLAPESVSRMAVALKKRGQIQPVLVRWSESAKKWMLIAGERRYQGAKEAGIETLNARIAKKTDTEDIFADQVAENMAREDLDPMDQAEAFRRLIEEFNWTQRRIADEMGVSQATVAQRLAILNADESVAESVRLGDLTTTEAYAVSQAPASAQPELVQKIVEGGLNRAEVQVEVDKAIAGSRPEDARPGTKAARRAGTRRPSKARAIGLERERVIRTASKIKVTAERSKGFDLATLRDALREAAAQIDAEVEAANGAVGAMISG